MRSATISRVRKVGIVAVITLSLLTAVAALTQRQEMELANAQKSRSAQSGEMTQASLEPASPSKEYIYAGGRLVATEEPIALAAPASLRATTLDSTRIRITWAPSSGAAKYELQRSANYVGANNGFSVVSSNITSTSFDDTVTTNAAYIYRVRALDSNTPPNASPFSELDLATAISFTEDPVSNGMIVKEVHITQLRNAVHYVRVAAGITAPEGWTDPTPPLAQVVKIKKVHIQELRDRLGDARDALEFPVPTYTDPTITQFVTTVRAAHIQELRRLVKGYKTYIDQP